MYTHDSRPSAKTTKPVDVDTSPVLGYCIQSFRSGYVFRTQSVDLTREFAEVSFWLFMVRCQVCFMTVAFNCWSVAGRAGAE